MVELVIMADTLDECLVRLRIWKTGMERKGLRVNMKKTKFLITRIGLDLLKDSGKYPYAVCRKGLGKQLQCLFSVQVRGGQETLRNIRPTDPQPKICFSQVHWIVAALRT